MNERKPTSLTRLILACAVLLLGAYWAGAHWGQHQPVNVGAGNVGAEPRGGSATPAPSGNGGGNVGNSAGSTSVAARDAALTDDEANNVRVYRQASPAVANVLTKATEYDFFMDPVPVEGAGSGFVIDERGYILTNFHVVQEAQSIEVVLGDQTRFPGKFVGADQRNDVALVKIDPKGKHLWCCHWGIPLRCKSDRKF
jgi:S1-C subfamily serine protease